MIYAEAVFKKCKIPSTNLDLLINLLNNNKEVVSTNPLNNKEDLTNLPELVKDSTNLLKYSLSCMTELCAKIKLYKLVNIWVLLTKNTTY